jgi:hypothetical protein
LSPADKRGNATGGRKVHRYAHMGNAKFITPKDYDTQFQLMSRPRKGPDLLFSRNGFVWQFSYFQSIGGVFVGSVERWALRRQASPVLSASSCFWLLPDIYVPFCYKRGWEENQQQGYSEFVEEQALW